MSDALGLVAFELDVRQDADGAHYTYEVSFYLKANCTWHAGSGRMESPLQCYNAAMAFLMNSMQAAEAERAI
jgi:hypothetical protein